MTKTAAFAHRQENVSEWCGYRPMDFVVRQNGRHVS